MTSQYMLGVLFLTATIDGFIWKAIRADANQDQEGAEHNKQIQGASHENDAKDE